MSYQWKSPRKKTFVSPQIQGRIMGRIVAYWVLYHFVLWNGLFVYRFAQYRSAITTGQEIVSVRELYSQFSSDFYPLLICAALILPAFLLDFVCLTHRIAGPLVRFRLTLRDLMAGKRVEQVTIRQRDLLSEFEGEFNEFLKFYNARLDAGETGADSEASKAERMREGDASLVENLVESERESAADEVSVAVNG